MSFNNTTIMMTDSDMTKSISDVLNQITANFISYLPLIITIFGSIGFIGNAFTYLQPELRSNTCCIYSFSGSIIDFISLWLNLFPLFLSFAYRINIPMWGATIPCKIFGFLLFCLPHLSINCLIMAIIDRFGATCSLTSSMRRLNQPKMVPIMIFIAIIISCLASIYNPIIFYFAPGIGCQPTQPTIANILYIILSGVSQPIVMLIFVLLTYRNIRISHQRVVSSDREYLQIKVYNVF